MEAVGQVEIAEPLLWRGLSTACNTTVVYEKDSYARWSLRLRERPTPKLGFLPGLMVTCSGCTPYEHGCPAGSGLSASKSLYSMIRLRKAAASVSTLKVWSWSRAAG